MVQGRGGAGEQGRLHSLACASKCKATLSFSSAQTGFGKFEGQQNRKRGQRSREAVITDGRRNTEELRGKGG